MEVRGCFCAKIHIRRILPPFYSNGHQVEIVAIMGKNTDTPAYLTSDDAKYTLGIHRGPLISKGDDEGAQLAHVESAGGLSLETRKLKRTEKFQRHWKRFWCLHLLVTIIFLAIFLPVL